MAAETHDLYREVARLERENERLRDVLALLSVYPSKKLYARGYESESDARCRIAQDALFEVTNQTIGPATADGLTARDRAARETDAANPL